MILPSWQSDQNTKDQEQLTVRLFMLLGRILVLPISPFLSELNIIRYIVIVFSSMQHYAARRNHIRSTPRRQHHIVVHWLRNLLLCYASYTLCLSGMISLTIISVLIFMPLLLSSLTNLLLHPVREMEQK